MTVYERMAKEHWANNLPHRYRELTDPDTYFADLGEQLLNEVNSLESTLLAAHVFPPDQPFLDRVSAIQVIRQRAESTVLEEHLWSLTDLPFTSTMREGTRNELIEALLRALPDEEGIGKRLWQLDNRIRQDREIEGLDPHVEPLPMTLEEENEHTMLGAILEAATLPRPIDDLTEQELRDRLARLREFLPTDDPFDVE